jgi:hypothetical protein
MHKRFLSLLGLFSLLATTNVQAADAPSSLVYKKLTLNATGFGHDEPFVKNFYFVPGSSRISDDWEWGQYSWSSSATSGTIVLEEMGDEKFELILNFSNYTAQGVSTEGSTSKVEGTATFTLTDFDPDPISGELPYARFFVDDFTDATTTESIWGNPSEYGLSASIYEGAYALSGTLTDEDERWSREFGAKSLLNLSSDWFVQGSAFSKSGERIELSIECDMDSVFQLEVHVGTDGYGVNSSIQYERDDQKDYPEQSLNNSVSSSAVSDSKTATFRIRNSFSEKTFHIEWLDGTEWKNLNSLNWETGSLSKDADSAWNESSKSQFHDWESMGSYYFNPQMEFSVPDSLTINKGDYGFTSFSVIEGAPVTAPSSLVGKKIRISFVETANDAEGVHEFYFAGNGKGWMRYWLESNDPSDETYWDDDNFTYQISGENSALLKLGTNEDYSEIPLTFTSENAGSFTAQGWKIENGSLVQTGPMNATGSFTLSDYDESELPASQGWLWFDQYPWVYSNREGGWLYFLPSNGKINVYSVRDKAWREMTKTE